MVSDRHCHRQLPGRQFTRLWTNSLNPGGVGSDCGGRSNNYFSLNAGSTLTEYDDGTAVLTATATNPADPVGINATINITFGSRSETHTPSKIKEGGGPELTEWDFYQSITNGVITIDGYQDNFTVGMHNGYSLQIGQGANDKSAAFGGSVWMDVTGNGYGGGHWDINMDLAPVPVPATVWLFGSALLGLAGFSRRRKTQA